MSDYAEQVEEPPNSDTTSIAQAAAEVSLLAGYVNKQLTPRERTE